ncbi:MAG: lysylphosphatidylglycerol synthase transmembrane domain-containing protein [Thermoguttaceae bacterium]|nr:lysylphosphatidylglycerol synthase transmembrane domain-containing protein [Thermoguttaceae bacterium]
MTDDKDKKQSEPILNEPKETALDRSPDPEELSGAEHARDVSETQPDKQKHASARSYIESILKDSVEYGVEYGLEDGIEKGISKGVLKGLREGASSTLVNGVEEAIGDYLGVDLDQPHSAAVDVVAESNKIHDKNEPPNGPGTADRADDAEPLVADKKQHLVRKRIIFFSKLVIVVLVLGWIAFRLGEAWTEISKYDWKLHYGWIFCSSIFYLAAYFPASVLWFLSLRWMGQRPDFFGAVRAFYASQLGKYLPGKAMVVVIRSGMVAGEKVRMSVAAVCVFYETLTMMATGAFLSALVICVYFREHWFYSLLALGTMLAAGLPVLPPIFIRVIHILGIGKKDAALHDYLGKITWRSVIVGFSLMTVLWLLFGVGLWAAIQGIGVTPGGFIANMPRYVSVTALAIVLGFAVPIAPGGIGIREAVLSILLIPYFETILAMPENGAVHVQADNLALIVSLEQRIISILAELTLVALFFIVPFVSRVGRCLIRGGKKQQV